MSFFAQLLVGAIDATRAGLEASGSLNVDPKTVAKQRQAVGEHCTPCALAAAREQTTARVNALKQGTPVLPVRPKVRR